MNFKEYLIHALNERDVAIQNLLVGRNKVQVERQKQIDDLQEEIMKSSELLKELLETDKNEVDEFNTKIGEINKDFYNQVNAEMEIQAATISKDWIDSQIR